MFFVVDDTNFGSAENKLETNFVPNDRKRQLSIQESVGMPQSYKTTIEELSRSYPVISVASDSSSTIPISNEKVEMSGIRFPEIEELDSLENWREENNCTLLSNEKCKILQHFVPLCQTPISTFRRTVPDHKAFVEDKHKNLLIKIGPSTKVNYAGGKHHIYEPIFGSVSLYSLSRNNVSNEYDLNRLSECFHFDATPPQIRTRYTGSVFCHEEDISFGNTEKTSSSNSNGINSGSSAGSVSASTGHIHPSTSISMCLASYPPIVNPDELYLVVLLQKVLTGEPDKALHPYINPGKTGMASILGTNDSTSKVQEACKRLWKYRQPVGFTIIKLFNPDGSMEKQMPANYTIYTMKYCLNDNSLKQHMVDMYRPEGSRQNRCEVLELDINLHYYDLGSDKELIQNLPEGMVSPSNVPLIHVLPSQYHTQEEVDQIDWHRKLGVGGTDMLVVRSLSSLPPKYGPTSEDVLRRIRMSEDHTLFVYPTQFENFLKRTERNLVLEVQLIQFDGSMKDSAQMLLEKSYNVLNAVYNRMPGPMFVKSARTCLSYHKTIPELNDEIKLKLPLLVTRSHALLLRMYHIHVKPKIMDKKSSFFGSSKKEEESDTTETIIGIGVLPLLGDDDCTFIADKEYTVPVMDFFNSEPSIDDEANTNRYSTSTAASSAAAISAPTRRGTVQGVNTSIKLVTRLLSSFVTTSRDLNKYLLNQPDLLGSLPSVNMPKSENSAEVNESTPHAVSTSGDKTDGSDNSPTLGDISQSPHVNESTLLDCTQFFLGLSSDFSSSATDPDDITRIEISKHFHNMMRQFFRVLCGGSSMFTMVYANPYNNPKLRCATFLSMLRVFDLIAPVNGMMDDDAMDKDPLRSYIDHMFDEEVFVPNDEQLNLLMQAEKSPKLLSKINMQKKANTDTSESALVDFLVQQVEEVTIRGVMLSRVKLEASYCVEQETHFGRPVAERWWRGKITDATTLFHGWKKEATERFENLSVINFTHEPVIVEDCRSRYDKLDGIAVRKIRLKEIMTTLHTNVAHSTAPPPYHWWPWVYEILVKQWSSLLNVFHIDDNSRGDITSLLVRKETSIIEEGDEEAADEDSDPPGYEDDSTNLVYPFSLQDSMFQKDKLGKDKDMRTFAMSYGPILLEMVSKSLSLRIAREGKIAPVILDEEFMNELERLVVLVTKEVNNNRKSVKPASKLNKALAVFLRNLFAIAAPLQVARLVMSYFITSRHCQKIYKSVTNKVPIDHIKDRIVFIKELATCDFFVLFNFPLQLDASYEEYMSKSFRTTKDFLLHASGSEVRGIKNPPSHWLMHVIIDEIMSDYLSVENTNKNNMITTIRDIAVNMTYDARNQSKELSLKCGAMFLPLLKYIVNDADRLKEVSLDDTNRKEELALVLYILQNVPEHLLREEWRRMCRMKTFAPPIQRGYSDTTILNNVTSSPSKIPPIFNMLALLHLILDTFDLGLTKNGAEGDIAKSLALELSPDVFSDNNAFTGTGQLEGKDSRARSGTGQFEGKDSRARSRVVGNSSNQAKNVKSKIDMLEANYKNKESRVGRRVSTGEMPSSSSTTGLDTSRKWKQNQALTMQNKNTFSNKDCISLLTALHAAKILAHESGVYVLQSLSIIIEEAPKIFHNVVDRYVDTQYDVKFQNFMNSALKVILHTLHVNQSEGVYVRAMTCATQFVQRFGAVLFMANAKDSFQDWLRIVIQNLSSLFGALRHSAMTFFSTLLHSCFYLEGTITNVAKVFIAVFHDSVSAVRDKLGHAHKLLSDSKYLDPLSQSIDDMLMSLQDNTFAPTLDSCFDAKPCHASLSAFMISIQSLIKSFKFLNDSPFILCPVAYSWNGDNYLDLIDNRESMHHKSIMFDETADSADDDISHILRSIEACDSYNLPRTKIFWIENLARFHDNLSNNAESGMARWMIYQTCIKFKKSWRYLWTPRMPLKWSKQERKGDTRKSGSKGIHFMDALETALASPSLRAWSNDDQFNLYIITSLTISAEKFAANKLLYLAERSLLHMIQIHQQNANDNIALIGKEYEKLSKYYSEVSFGTMAFAMGSYFRVMYSGKGVPLHMRDKEYVYRNVNHLHVSEFQTLIKAICQREVGNNIAVTVLSDTAAAKASGGAEDEGACLSMTSLNPIYRPVMENRGTSLHSQGHSSIDLNQVVQFQFAVPFTRIAGKAHAKTMDGQWKRRTVITVKHPFPYVSTRQEVVDRTVRDLNPFEVAIDDVVDRIDNVNELLNRREKWHSSELNNLMRLVQGTVCPQVNAGAGEVARVFLQRVDSPLEELPESLKGIYTNDMELIECRDVLKEKLVLFLKKSRLLLDAARQELDLPEGDISTLELPPRPPPSSSAPPPPSSSSSSATDITLNQSLIWLKEMEKGYKNLVTTILPYVCDIVSESEFPTIG